MDFAPGAPGSHRRGSIRQVSRLFCTVTPGCLSTLGPEDHSHCFSHQTPLYLLLLHEAFPNFRLSLSQVPALGSPILAWSTLWVGWACTPCRPSRAQGGLPRLSGTPLEQVQGLDLTRMPSPQTAAFLPSTSRPSQLFLAPLFVDLAIRTIFKSCVINTSAFSPPF